MASAEEYAKWIVDNQDKQGTPDFDTVAKAYQAVKNESPKREDATMMERGKAALGGVNRGIAGLLGMPVDTAENVANLGIAAFGAGATALGRPDLAPELFKGTPGGSESIAGLMGKAGIDTANPRPDDMASRMLHTGGVIAGGSIVPGATVKGALAAATGGALAGEALGPEWTGVGALAPGAIAQASIGVKNAVAKRAAPVVDTFKAVGAMPSVGQATDNVFLHGLENLAAKFPGGSGVMKGFIEAQQKNIGATARTGVPTEAAGRAIESGIKGTGGFLDRTKQTWSRLDDLVAEKIGNATFYPSNTVNALQRMTARIPGAEATSGEFVNPRLSRINDNLSADLGAARDRLQAPISSIEQAAANRNASRTRALQDSGRMQTDAAIQENLANGGHTQSGAISPSAYPVPGLPRIPGRYTENAQRVPEALSAADEFTKVANIKGSERDILNNATNILRTTMGDNNGILSYNAVRQLRSHVGAMIDDRMISDIPNGELKKLYGALSEDLKSAADTSGAGKEFARQNNYYRARMDRIESVLDRVIGKGRQPEDIFKAVNPTDPDQSNKLRAVMRSLDPSERQVVSEAVVNRLGRATPGNQNELGEIFSSETFLTNWNKLSKGAKQQLFPDPPLRENVDKIAKAASLIRAGKGIYANPSGTAGSFAAYGVYSSPIVSVATGSLAPVLAGVGAAGAAYIGAKMLTNPKVVAWLATPVNPSSRQAAAHLARLNVIYNQSDDPQLRDEISQFVQSVQ